MSCENKLTNLVFKNKENSARTTMCFIFPSFLSLFLFIIIKKKNTYNEMHECNAMQLLEIKEKNIKTKKQRTMVTKEKQ